MKSTAPLAELNESNKVGDDQLTQDQTSNETKNSCHCVEHLGFELMNREFELSVDYLHKMLFTDNELIRKVWTFRKLLKVELSEWMDNKITTNYTIGLGAFGSAKTHETIRILDTDLSSYIVTESESNTKGAPYTDYVTVYTRFCITKLDEHKSHIQAHVNIVYNKQPLSFIKNILERNTERIMKESYGYVEKLMMDVKPDPDYVPFSHLKYSTSNKLESPKRAETEGIKDTNQDQTHQEVSKPVRIEEERTIKSSSSIKATPAKELKIPRNRKSMTRSEKTELRVSDSEASLSSRPSSPSSKLMKNHSELIVKSLIVMLLLIFVFNAHIYMKLKKAEDFAARSLMRKGQLGKNDSHVVNLNRSLSTLETQLSYLSSSISDTIKRLENIENRLDEFESLLARSKLKLKALKASNSDL